MARINDTTTYPITAPVSDDIVIGTDISNTTNSANGETVNFTAGSIADLAFTSAWHPYNKTVVGDSNTGLFYSFAVDGAVSEIETPDFELGYEYAVFFDSLNTDSGNTEFQIDLFKAGSSYHGAVDITQTYSGSSNLRGILYLPFISLAETEKRWQWLTGGSTRILDGGYGRRERMTKAKFEWADGGNSSSGDVYLYRRREFITG